VMFGPLLPGISDTEQALDELFSLAAQADVDSIWTDALNPRPLVWPSVQALLRDRWPDLLEPTRRLLFDRDYRSRYQTDLNQRIDQVAADVGLTDRLG